MLQSFATFMCDVMITFSLLRRLSIAKSGIKKSDALVNRLMINAINRGGLTAVMAAINLVLVLTARDSLAFILPLIISSKLYMNSVLASLNSRAGIKEKYMNGPVTDGGIAISNGPLSTIRFVQSIPEDHPAPWPVLEISVHSDACTDNQQEKMNGTQKRRGSV
ncbi:hypothetical protein BJ165DRAFT_1484326 [Panaeolus papilionaceus]|nr:hypothetical protein BJ165DRAFT_1484326 [Panaeolus papilionaceus]